MTEREKDLRGLEICANDVMDLDCRDCPYSENVGCAQMERDARVALQEDMDRIEELENTVHNLRLYLTALKKMMPAEAWELFEEKMSGLPGYTEVWKDDA